MIKTKQRDNFIAENYGKLTISQLAEATGLSYSSVKLIARCLGKMKRNTKRHNADFDSVRPLCDTCRWATPLKCKFFAQRGDPVLVEEYDMEWATVVARYCEGGSLLVKVTKCNKYERGPLFIPGRREY